MLCINKHYKIVDIALENRKPTNCLCKQSFYFKIYKVNTDQFLI